MKPGKYTIQELFVNCEIEQIIIPEIQRDYVWKKEQVEGLLYSLKEDFTKYKNESVEIESQNEEIKKLFVQFYKKQLYSSNIGFIYAYNDEEYKGKYFLIDGQQRVTTIYLLLLNLFIKTNQKKEFKEKYFADNLLKIDFKVRENTHDFFIKFIQFALNFDNQEKFSDLLYSQYWFFSDYENDISINSIIANNQIISDFIVNHSLDNKDFLHYILNYVDCWYFDTNMSEQGEELYIYMNARGEQIQNNENIKADLLGALKENDLLEISKRKDYKEEKNINGLKKYWGKKWEEWQDYFWEQKGLNENADKGFNEFLKCIAGLEQYEIKLDFPLNKFNSNYDLLSIETIEKHIDNFKWLNQYKQEFSKQYNYHNWLDKALKDIWSLFNNETTDWFADYGDDKKSIDLNRMAFIWPIFLYLKRCSTIDLDERFRVLRIFHVRFYNNIRAVKSIKGLIEFIVKHGIFDKNNLQSQNLNSQIDDEEESKNVKTFLKEEIEKHRFLGNLANDTLRVFEELIWEIEDHPINLNGKNLKNKNITHLVEFNQSLSIDSLRLIKDKFYELFPIDNKSTSGFKEFKKLQILLLHFGEFKQRVSPYYLENYNYKNWGRIVRGLDGDAFQSLFSFYISQEEKIDEILITKENEFCAHNLDTPVMLIQNLNFQLIVYSKALGINLWSTGGHIAIRPWDKSDGLFINSKEIYNLQSNFISKNVKLWDLIPSETKNQINEKTTVSDLFTKILKNDKTN
jgi:hypothetical protein